MARVAIEELPLSIAAQRLGLSWSQTWRLVLIDRLPARRIGGRWLVSGDGLMALEAVRKQWLPRRESS